MDIIYEGKESEVVIPYFGQQSRFFKFFYDVISKYIKKGDIYAETNSGSNGNAYMFAKNGYRVIINDKGEYSNCIANAILSDDDKVLSTRDDIATFLKEYSHSYLDRASVFAALMDELGYNYNIPQKFDEKTLQTIKKYKSHLSRLNKKNIRAYKIFNDDLFDYLKKLEEENIVVDAMFMDFAWPWRDGSKTEEYETSANILTNVFADGYNKVDIWDKTNVIENVLKAVRQAQKVSKYVFLSNQSSNFPTPELLEVALLKNGIQYIERHTMLTNATNEDNLNKCDFFREYLYVIEGGNLKNELW